MNDLNIEFDYDATRIYRDKYEVQCDCAYCRNYYKAFKSTYPKTAVFLESFGLDVNFPLEAMPLFNEKSSNTMEYNTYYPVKGEMSEDEIKVDLEGLEIYVLKGSDKNNPCPNPKMEEPYLFIEILGIQLPWVLDEDME